MGRRTLVVLALALAANLAIASTAWSAVTIGSQMASTPNAGTFCGSPPCSVSQTALAGRLVASPVNGIVVAWRADYSGGGPTRISVIRPFSGGAIFTAFSSSDAMNDGATHTTAIPISIGDRIALEDTGAGGNPVGRNMTAGGTYEAYDPTPAAGGSGGSTVIETAFELYLNADIEPNNQIALGKLKRNRRKGNATLTVEIPNPGTLQATSAAGGAASAAKASALVKPRTVKPTTPGAVKLKLTPTKGAKARLRARGKASGRVAISFTPIFGTASTLSFKAKLKLEAGA